MLQAGCAIEKKLSAFVKILPTFKIGKFPECPDSLYLRIYPENFCGNCTNWILCQD